MVSKLNLLSQFSTPNNDSSTLMSTNQWHLRSQWPVSILSMEIGVADSRVLDVDQDFIWTWNWNWHLLILEIAAGLVEDLRPLLLRDLAEIINTGTHFGGFEAFGWWW